MRSKSAKRRSQAAFSLVEMLVVIAVIGIMAAIGVVALHGINQSAGNARDIENARSLASIAQSAQAAGVDFVDPDGDVEQTIRNLSTGGSPSSGAFAGQIFRVPLADGEVARVASYLRVNGGLLVYTPE